MKRSLLALLIGLVVLLAAGSTRWGVAQADGADAYCCLCADCAGAGCVLVPVLAPGFANPEHTCPTLCPMDCRGSLLVEGACSEHTAAECPVTERAPALSPWVGALCVAALGAYGVRRVRRS